MFATLRCSRVAASRTAAFTAGLMRRFNVEILVRAMHHNVPEKKRKCNALLGFCTDIYVLLRLSVPDDRG